MELDVVVETPMGSRNKYEMDDRSRLRLDRTLFTATQYPADYGFVDGTLAEDGQPLDALVLVAERTFPGCLINSRPVAVFWMQDEDGPDAKLLCVSVDDPRQAAVNDLPDVPWYVVAEIGHFFEVYKQIEPGKCTDTRGWQGRQSAEQLAQEAFARFSI